MINYKQLEKLVGIDSPSGFTLKAGEFLFQELKRLGFKPKFTNKRAVTCHLGTTPVLSIAAHFDTLGAVVTELKSNGTLGFSLIGSPSLNSLDGEYVRVHTLEGKVLTGTIQLNNPAKHVNQHLSKMERSIENMHIVLDELVSSKADVVKLGINTGDIVAFETHYQETESGYIKSRFMDNKAGCLVLLELARKVAEQNIEVPVELFFSNYEEVGHGGTCGFASSIEELLVIDMGVVGDGCNGKETHCSICAKDSTGPYDYGFRKKLVELARENGISFELDVYPFYGSDGSAALRAGNDFRVALIGPGVAASHGKERTHKQGIEATIDLCMAYIQDRFS